MTTTAVTAATGDLGMTIRETNWVARYAATADARSKEIVAGILRAELDAYRRIVGTIKDKPTRADYVRVFADDVARVEAALEALR